MTLWTIQSEAAWTELQKTGVLRATRGHAWEPSFLPAYEWMTRQMHSRLGPPPEPDCLPIWAWYQFDGKRKKPDLRQRGHVEPGETGVRLELHYPGDRAVLSDFSLWHHVLNYWYLPSSEQEGDAFEQDLAHRGLSFYTQKPLPDPAYHSAVEASWDRIFDLDWAEPDVSVPRAEKSIQATLWEINLQQVQDVRVFTGR